MADTRPYPRFGGDRKLTKGTLAGCECCNNDTHATHEVTIELDGFKVCVNVCPWHVGMARRFHTFEKFLEAAEGRD